jgi:myo-inositol 2-dehydrogenase / D-chiro-inositol 1-dehydrogenase
MTTRKESKKSSDYSRREFIQRTAVTGAAAYGAMAMAPKVHAAGSDTIKIGLIGCGGRGSGAATNAMNSGKDVHLVAMADVFAERIEDARPRLKQAYPEQVAVDDAHCFIGFDAYKKVIESGVDVVVIATASHFHPVMIKAAIDAGKHVFCEKPHSLDVPGAKMVKAATEKAKEKGLGIVSGLCWRYDLGVQETVKRIQDGAIGEIIAIEETYLRTPYILRERKPEWNEMQYQLQNWYHFNWLSGDDTAQSLIHNMTITSCLLGNAQPKSVWGMGGRQVCVEPKYGDVFDHQAMVYEYPNNVRVFGYSRDLPGCFCDNTNTILGTKGQAYLPGTPSIEGKKKWKFQGKRPSMYDLEHKALFDGIRSGKPVNNGDYMYVDTMVGIMAQMACYTGQVITWEDAEKSDATFALPRYGWDVEPPVKLGPDGRYPTAMPGITKFGKHGV